MPYCKVCGAEELADQKFCTSCGTPSTGPFTTPAPLPYFEAEAVNAAEAAGIAGFWWRALSFVIDVILVTIASVVIGLAVGSAGKHLVVAAIIGTIVSFLYFGLLLRYRSGQTLGMAATHLRCVNLSDRGPLRSQQVYLRTAAYCALLFVSNLYHLTNYKHPTVAQTTHQRHELLVAFVIVLPHALDLLWAAWDRNRQTLHDKVAKTVVIREVR